ncbi:MAG: hypothetical protein GY697_12905 [Desulfobacterales bacterium]|nr:hypothetical protein [Desulfobacterales bacterium]
MNVHASDRTADANTPNAIARRIAWNHKTFSAYNIDRVREMLRYLPPRRIRLFEAIPFLLHVNHPKLTGYVGSPGVPFGISRFYQSGYWKLGLKQFGFSQAAIRPFLSDNDWVHGLYLMGSIGTLAQTIASDFDYWVVVDEAAKDTVKLALLKKKLDRITEWGQSAYDQQITFFILDIDRVRACDFTAVDEESSGSAQKSLLKEEFYRTFIMVAGKIPYWSVLPPRLAAEDYHRWIELAGQARTAAFENSDYLDLGPLDIVELSECLGALLWQIYKARHDPVKALIKGALIAHYYFFQDESGLLCDHAKDGFSESGKMSGPVDPYTAIFDQAEMFFARIQDTDGVDLIRTCIYLRLISFPRRRPVVSGSPKETLIKRFLKQWQWPQKVQNDLQSYENWPITRLADFEEVLIKKIGFLFELVRRHGADNGLGFDMLPADLTGLKNRIAAVFKPRPEKISRCPLVIQKSMPRTVTLTYAKETTPGWRLALAGEDQVLLEKDDLVHIAGWMIRNRLIPASQPNLRLRAFGQPMAANRIIQLFFKAEVFFNQDSTPQEDYQSSPSMERLLAVVTDQVPTRAGTIISILWRNAWGEMYFRKMPLDNCDSNWSLCFAVAGCIQALKKTGGSIQTEYRIWDYRLRPETTTEATVLDMLASMDQLDANSDGEKRIGKNTTRGVDTGPLLDLF